MGVDRTARIVALAAGGVALATALTGCGSRPDSAGTAGTPSPVATSDPAPTTAPAPSGTSASPTGTGATPTVTPKRDPSAVPGTGIPTADQAVWLQATTTRGYPLVTAESAGRVGATSEADAGDGALFALTPISRGGDEYLLKTGVLGASGVPECAARDGDRVVIDACDTRESVQRVSLDGDDAPFEVRLGGRALRVTDATVSVVAPGQGTPLTFIIRGKAQDPFD